MATSSSKHFWKMKDISPQRHLSLKSSIPKTERAAPCETEKAVLLGEGYPTEAVTPSPTHSSAPPTLPHPRVHVLAQEGAQRGLAGEFPSIPGLRRKRGDGNHLRAGSITCNNLPVLADEGGEPAKGDPSPTQGPLGGKWQAFGF